LVSHYFLQIQKNFSAVGYTTTVMFAHRYYQTTGSRHIWFYFLEYVLYCLLTFTIILLPLNIVGLFTREARAVFREDAKIYSLIKNESLVFVFDVSFYTGCPTVGCWRFGAVKSVRSVKSNFAHQKSAFLPCFYLAEWDFCVFRSKRC
jgi:hypothetical protein